MPPALPADPSQDLIYPARPTANTMAVMAVSEEICGLGGLFVGGFPCKPSMAHVICCVWRC